MKHLESWAYVGWAYINIVSSVGREGEDRDYLLLKMVNVRKDLGLAL